MEGLKGTAMRYLFTILILAFSFGLACAESQKPPKRVALLIANERYDKDVGVLKQPRHDVGRLAAALKAASFEVRVAADLNFSELSKEVEAFVDVLRQAPPKSISFFYYSGHGVSRATTRENYLVPIDARRIRDDTFWHTAYRADQIPRRLQEDAQRGIHFVVFDACRNELLTSPEPGTKAVGTEGFTTKGFGSLTNAPVLIAFSTAEGHTAADSGVFSTALADEMLKPNADAVMVFRRAQLRVRKELNQSPHLSYGAIDEVFFKDLATGVVGPVVEPKAPASTKAVHTDEKLPELAAALAGVAVGYYRKAADGDKIVSFLKERRVKFVELQGRPEHDRHVTNALLVGPKTNKDTIKAFAVAMVESGIALKRIYVDDKIRPNQLLLINALTSDYKPILDPDLTTANIRGMTTFSDR